MTTLLRTMIAAVFVGLFSASVFGFMAQRSLDDSDGFAQAMNAALEDPQVKSELSSAVRTSVLDAVQDLGDNGGLFGSLLSGVGGESLADAAARAVNTPAFEEAWDDWARLVHRGLADFAVGHPNSDLSVDGQYLEVQIGPLVKLLLGTGLAASSSGSIDALIGDRGVVVDTGEDIEARLELLGVFADARWIFAAGAALSLGLVALIGPRRLRWLAISLAAAATGLVFLAIVLTFADSSIPSSATPALNESIRSALRNGWTATVGITATILLAAATGLALISRGNSADDAADQNPI